MTTQQHHRPHAITAYASATASKVVNTTGMNCSDVVTVMPSSIPYDLEQALIADAELLGLLGEKKPPSNAMKLVKALLVVMACAAVVLLLQIATVIPPIKH